MSQFSITTTTVTTNTHHLSSLVFSYFLHFSSFVFSHPLYLSYFIFFSPYLVKLLSFLSPLFITTSLFLLPFLSIHTHPYSQYSEAKLSFLLASYQKVLNALSWSPDEENVDEFHLFQELQACMVLLGNDQFSDASQRVELNLEDKPEATCSPRDPSELTSKSLTNPPLNDEKEHKMTKRSSDSVTEHKYNLQMPCSTAVTPYGSMRKDKEWKRTLACKLYEERQHVDGSEGMDLLWEKYEADSGKTQKSVTDKGKMEYAGEDDEVDVNLCCLQALKLSTRKMNLGMGRPNLVKISKALKGIGWFHHGNKSCRERRVT